MYVMGDGLQVRQNNLTEYSVYSAYVSVIRAWRCLLLLGAIGMLVVACSLYCCCCVWLCLGFVPLEEEQKQQPRDNWYK